MKTEEQLVRELLHQAVELPDELRPPIARLIKRGHSSRVQRTVLASVAAAAVVVAGAAAPSVIAGLRSASSRAGGPSASGRGPTAAQLAGYRWSELASSPLGRSGESILGWTGKELLEIGYQRNSGASTDSAAFAPATGRWHSIAPEPGWVDPLTAMTAWTGHQFFVVGMLGPCATVGGPSTCVPRVEAYTPATNTWLVAPLPPSFGQKGKLYPYAVAWTGRQVVVAGTTTPHGKLAVGAYSPASRRWRVITPTLAVRHPLWNPVGIFPTGHGLILWTSWMHVSDKAGSHRLRFGAEVFIRDKGGIWTSHTDGWPKSAFVSAPTRAGRSILVPPVRYDYDSHGLFVDPGTLAVHAITPSPFAAELPAFSWTGRAIIAVNAFPAEGKSPAGLMAAYDPAARSWRDLPAVPGLLISKSGAPGLAADPVWTGTELLALNHNGVLAAFHH